MRLLESEGLADRSLAIQAGLDLAPASISPRLAKRFIAELKRTQREIPASNDLLDAEELADHYGDVIQLVARLNDADSIEPLIGAIDTGHMATDALANYGDQAALRLADMLDSGSARATQVVGILETFGKMAKGKTRKQITEHSRGRIKEIARRVLEQTNDIYVLEEAAILAYDLNDPIAIKTVEELARTPEKLKARNLRGKNAQKRGESMLTEVIKTKSKSKQNQ